MATINYDTVRVYDTAGIRLRRIVVYTGPASYATGGDSLIPQDLKLGAIEAVLGGVAWNGSAVRLLAYDYVNQRVVWYIPNTGAEVAGAVDLSTFTARLEVIGK